MTILAAMNDYMDHPSPERIYALLVRIAALFNPKAKELIVGRKQVWD
jgi:hypothetical protein